MNYSIWKFVDGDGWGWNLSPREVNVEILPAVMNDARVLPCLSAKVLLRTELRTPSTQACSRLAEGSSSSQCNGEQVDFSLKTVCVLEYALRTTFTVPWGGFLVLLWLLPVPAARAMLEAQCSHSSGCESLSVCLGSVPRPVYLCREIEVRALKIQVI